ncbi:hypothetical protein [Halomonas hibernica]|uniref:hypothetical protein n=1 Tax=Halomonas hibernica TaxID=2591147 RepID=UPI001555FFEE|nr:hypothetical protein [Halomonas hibernica]
MSEENSVNGLDGKVGNYFSYQQFESDNHSRIEHQQRWKLLESIANQAPQTHQAAREPKKVASPFSAVAEPVYRSQSMPQENSLSRPVTSAEPVQRASSVNEADGIHHNTQHRVASRGAHFDHLFEAYSEKRGEPEQADPKQAPLKSLLRQINS